MPILRKSTFKNHSKSKRLKNINEIFIEIKIIFESIKNHETYFIKNKIGSGLIILTIVLNS